MKMWIRILFTGILLSGCSLAPRYERPAFDLPEGMTGKGMVEEKWWKGFGDERLDALVDEALRNNGSIKMATARMEEALAGLRLAEAGLYPETGGEFTLSRTETAEGSLQGGKKVDLFSFLGFISYEVDLWKRMGNQKKAALANLLATKAARQTVRISLTSTVVSTYLELISLKRQIETTEEMIKRYREIYEFREKQFRHGLVDELVVRQAEAEYRGTLLLLEALKERRKLMANTLLILLGREPRAFFEDSIDTPDALPQPLPIPSFLPSSILERRPDVVEAEERLKAANLEVGIARTAYFPSISLTGLLGFESSELRDLFSPSGGTWTVGGDLLAPFINFGRIRAGVRVAEAKKREALINYIETVKHAFKEVADALERIEGTSARLEAQQRELKILERILALAERKFERGLVDYLVVLDAQRRYLRARLNLIALRTELLKGQVLLYKALGGGWKAGEEG